VPSSEAPAASSPSASPSAVDALLILFEALPADDQAAAFQRLSLAHARRQAGAEADTERMLRSLARVGEVAGSTPPTSTEYRRVSSVLIAEGEDVASFSQIYTHFDRQWANVVEAAGLSHMTTARKIEARFQSRRLGKVARYTDAKLGDALDRCSAFFVAKHELKASERYAPLESEFEWWRERELELARARGDDFFKLPSPTPYRNRWGTWERALAHFGFTAQQIAERLDRIPPPPRHTVEKTPMPAGLPIATLRDSPPADVDADTARRIKAAYEALTPRTRYVLTVRLGLAGASVLKLSEVGEALDLHLTSIHQTQAKALARLATALPEGIGGDRRTHAGELLRRLAVRTETSD